MHFMDNNDSIENCNDIDILKRLCLEYKNQIDFVYEITVAENAQKLSAFDAIDEIKFYLEQNMYKREIKYCTNPDRLNSLLKSNNNYTPDCTMYTTAELLLKGLTNAGFVVPFKKKDNDKGDNK